jgi:hypothetical protein
MPQISQETVWQAIWPTVEGLIEATLAEDDAAIRPLLIPGSPAAAAHDFFGHAIFDILLKTVLGRRQLGLTRAVETEKARYVHIEYAWPDPEAPDGGYTAADVVSVRLRQYRGRWRVEEVNPAAIDLPLTGPRARGILITSKAFSDSGAAPAEPWLLPVALYGGALQIPLRPGAMADAVERLLLPGLQHRAYGLMSQLAGRRLWRDFKKKGRPQLDNPAAWAAAVEFIMSEQSMREMSQAAVGQHYAVTLAQLLPRVNRIKKTLHIRGADDRYSALRPSQIILST